MASGLWEKCAGVIRRRRMKGRFRVEEEDDGAESKTRSSPNKKWVHFVYESGLKIATKARVLEMGFGCLQKWTGVCRRRIEGYFHLEAEDGDGSENRSLPEEIVVEILTRAAFKTLLRCRCVCKTWRSLISQPSFIHTQLLKSHRNNQISEYVIFSNKEFRSTSFNFHALCGYMTKELEFPGKTAFGFRHPVLFGREYFAGRCCQSADSISRLTIKVVGSCNGLLCLFSNKGVILWNPAISKIRVIEESDCADLEDAGGLCYIPQTGDFKVVTIDCSSIITPPKVQIYSTETNSWKEASPSNSHCWDIRQKCPTPFVGGALHWCARRMDGDGLKEVILCFDALEEAFREIDVPAEKGLERIVQFQGTIACFLDDANDLSWEAWVMKEYGVADSWTKLCTFGYIHGSPLEIMSNGEVMLTGAGGDGDFFLFDPTTEFRRREVEAKPGCRNMVAYMGSFALINEGSLSRICPYCCPLMITFFLLFATACFPFFLSVLGLDV